MKKAATVVIIGTFLATLILASCSSGASHQSWHPKTGKKPKPGKNHQ